MPVETGAHEYFLEAQPYQVNSGDQFGIIHKNGTRFKGSAYPWIDRWNIRSEAWQDGQSQEVRGKDGDRPALQLQARKPGLITIIHESDWSLLTFKKWQKFIEYLDDEGLPELANVHIERNLPQTEFKEIYARFAKTLVQVGEPGIGADQETGLTIELTALANPYGLARGQTLPVRLTFNGKPLTNMPIKTFFGHGTDQLAFVRTDADGRAEIPDSGAGPYLLNSVLILPEDQNSDKALGSVWRSYWASLTFERN